MGKKRISASISEEWGLKIPLSTIRNIVSKVIGNEIIYIIKRSKVKLKCKFNNDIWEIINKNLNEHASISNLIIKNNCIIFEIEYNLYKTDLYTIETIISSLKLKFSETVFAESSRGDTIWA